MSDYKRFEAGVTVIKSITQFTYYCPACDEFIIMNVHPSDVSELYDGCLLGHCPTCGAEFDLYYEDEIS